MARRFLFSRNSDMKTKITKISHAMYVEETIDITNCWSVTYVSMLVVISDVIPDLMAEPHLATGTVTAAPSVYGMNNRGKGIAIGL